MSNPNDFYSMEQFISELKSISGIPDSLSEDIKNTPKSEKQNNISVRSKDANSVIQQDKYEMKKRLDESLRNLNKAVLDSENYYSGNENEIMKVEMTNLRKENSELKFCLNSINKKLSNEINEIRDINEQKDKEILKAKETIKKNASLIELLGEKIVNYEKIFKRIEEGKDIDNLDLESDLKQEGISNENNQLKQEIAEKDEIIKNYKEELDTKKEIFNEIDGLKKEMESYLKTMDNLYKEIEVRDKIIQELKKSMEIIQNNYKKEITQLKTNKNIDEITGEEDILDELKHSKENEIQLSQQLIEMKKNYDEAKINNDKMQELTKEANEMIKSAIDSRDNLKKEYDSTIKEIVEKYEKQIQILELALANKKGGLTQGKKGGGDLNPNLKKNENINKKALQYLYENKELMEQNEELKSMNEMLIKKMKELPDLEKKFSELFETVKLLKKENDLLKQTNQFSDLLNIERAKKMQADEENEEEIQDINLENNEPIKSAPVIKQKEIYFNNMNKENQGSTGDLLNDGSNNQKKVYNRKRLGQQSPKLLKDSQNKSNEELLVDKEENSIKNKPENNQEKSQKYRDSLNDNDDDNEIDGDKKDKKKTEEEVEDEDEENTNEGININFCLYKPIKEGFLSFNLAKKNYFIMTPEKYQDFWNTFDPESSIQYNTLEGLFIVNFKNQNQLYYYSSKKNSLNELFKFKENHSFGCLFLDNSSKNIIALGGKESKIVEKFSFENGLMEQLPELSTHRSKMSCCQVDNKIYCFFGISEERPNESLIEYLDLENKNNQWTEIQFHNQTGFNIITCMSCINLNDNELLIIGGLIEDKTPNEKLLYYNTEQNELIELNKDLPDSEDKRYLFTQNSIFNLFLNGNLISFANIDDNNHVHILDNELKYELYLR